MAIPIYFWFPVLGSIGLGFFFMNIPPAAAQFMEIFNVREAGLAFFLSAIYWTHSISQVPAGVLVDKLGALRSLFLCLALCLVCSLLPFVAPASLPLAVLMRLAIGFGTGTLFLAMVKIAKILTPPSLIARVQAAQGAAFSLGTMLPYLTLPWMGPYAWIMAYTIGAIFCLIYGLAAFRLPARQLEAGKAGSSLPQIWAALKVIACSKDLWFLGVCHGFAYGSLNAIGNWLPAILVEAEPGSVLATWAIATSVMLLVGTVGRISGSEAARLMPRRMLICRAVFLIAFFYWGLAFANTPTLILSLALVMAFICGTTYASIFTQAIELGEPDYVATAVGFMNMVANGVNVLLILTMGNLKQFSGSFSTALYLVGGVAIITYLVGRRLGWTRG